MGRLLKLTEIATRKCVRHVHQLDDIGILPYHLVKPILEKMNAKQLNVIEQNSPHLLPHSDELWVDLIKRDFPSRPIYSENTFRKKLPGKLANKQLYLKYNQEQELFRKDSTERLKKFTKSLQRQKSENSVIEVEQILREPSIKSVAKGPKNSILNKAKRELQNRSLMFPNKKITSRPLIKPAGRRVNLNQHIKPIERNLARPEPRKNPLESKLAIQRKRKPPQPLSPQKPSSPHTLSPHKRKKPEESSSDVKSIKSSVFNL